MNKSVTVLHYCMCMCVKSCVSVTRPPQQKGTTHVWEESDIDAEAKCRKEQVKRWEQVANDVMWRQSVGYTVQGETKMCWTMALMRHLPLMCLQLTWVLSRHWVEMLLTSQGYRLTSRLSPPATSLLQFSHLTLWYQSHTPVCHFVSLHCLIIVCLTWQPIIHCTDIEAELLGENKKKLIYN